MHYVAPNLRFAPFKNTNVVFRCVASGTYIVIGMKSLNKTCRYVMLYPSKITDISISSTAPISRLFVPFDMPHNFYNFLELTI